MSKLGDSLLETHKIITGERLDSYGKPEDCFSIIADLWNSYLIAREKIILKEHSIESDEYSFVPLLKPTDVANLMILFKLARLLGNNPTRDTYLDIQGYAAIATDVLNQENKRD